MHMKKVFSPIVVSLMLVGCGQVDTGEDDEPEVGAAQPSVPDVTESTASNPLSSSSAAISSPDPTATNSSVPTVIQGLWSQTLFDQINYTNITAEGIRESYVPDFRGNNCYNLDDSRTLTHNGGNQYTQSYSSDSDTDDFDITVIGNTLTFSQTTETGARLSSSFDRAAGIDVDDLPLCDS